jgi:hypothetical protein
VVYISRIRWRKSLQIEFHEQFHYAGMGIDQRLPTTSGACCGRGGGLYRFVESRVRKGEGSDFYAVA